MYTLFQIMTLESWSMGIVRPGDGGAPPAAWLFFVPFILIATFTMLNLFIGIIVDTMQTMHEADHASDRSEIETTMHGDTERVLAEVQRLRAEIAELRAELTPSSGAIAGTDPDRPTG
jgi:voltage-gated sodium channel